MLQIFWCNLTLILSDVFFITNFRPLLLDCFDTALFHNAHKGTPWLLTFTFNYLLIHYILRLNHTWLIEFVNSPKRTSHPVKNCQFINHMINELNLANILHVINHPSLYKQWQRVSMYVVLYTTQSNEGLRRRNGSFLNNQVTE